MAASGPKESGAMLAEINVTPLVDVMLVLLIIFMVTAPMIQQGVDVDLPEARATAITQEEGKLILTLTAERRVYLGKMEIPFGELEEKLKANAKVQTDREVFLHADKRLDYGSVVQVMAAIKNAGVDRLGMVTDPMEQADSTPTGTSPSAAPTPTTSPAEAVPSGQAGQAKPAAGTPAPTSNSGTPPSGAGGQPPAQGQ